MIIVCEMCQVNGWLPRHLVLMGQFLKGFSMSRLLAASTSVSKLHFGYKKFRLDFHSGLRVASHVGDSVPATLTWTPAFHDKTIFMLESFWLRSQVLVTSTRVILGLYSLPRHRSFRQMYSHESVQSWTPFSSSVLRRHDSFYSRTQEVFSF